MILKLLKGNGDYDLHARVRSVSFRHDAAQGSVVDVTFEGADGQTTYPLIGKAFVLNDKGDTIERFTPQEGR